MLRAVRKRRAYEDVVKQIRRLIEKGKLKRDDQLPTERELSEIFKVSRATVREAIFSLEATNLVRRRQGDGTYVIATSEETLIRPLAAYLFHEKDDMIDIFSLRKIIEPEIAQLAAENATPEDIIELEEVINEQKKEMITGKNSVLTDSEFHRTLARTAKNRVLERLMLALTDLLKKAREKYFQTEERKQKSLNGHLNIFAAVKKGNRVNARKAMRRHIEDLEDIVFEKKRRTGQ